MNYAKFAFKFASASLMMAALLAPAARADISVTIAENKAKAREQSGKSNFLSWLFKTGTGGPGHTVLFVSDLCLQTKDGKPDLFNVRLCDESDAGEKGVYLSFISGLSGGYAWIAMPPSLYLYGTVDAKNKPLFTTSFDLDYYNGIEKSRPISQRSDKLNTDDTNHARYSALDLVRSQILPAMNGSSKAGDKVNIFVTPERDVYSLTIIGDTRAEAQKLLKHLTEVKNLAKATPADQSVEGSFGWWHNCTSVVNNWMNIMFDNKLNVGGNIFELSMNNPRNYANGVIGKMKNFVKDYNQGKDEKDKRRFVITYYPKITSDRQASNGFGSPAQNLYDPRTIGGAFMVKGQLWQAAMGGHPELAAIFFLGNLKNILFHMNRPYHEFADIGISQEDIQTQAANGNATETAKEIAKDAAKKFFGSKEDWARASELRTRLMSQLAASPNTPEELKFLIASNASQKVGHFSYDVAGIMALRSQAFREGDNLGFKFHFKKIVEDGKGSKIQGEDEDQELTTLTSEAGLRNSSNALSAMLTLAVIDNFLGQNADNRPAMPEMSRYLNLANDLVTTVAPQ